MRRLVDDEVGERVGLREVVGRDVAGHLLAQAQEARRVLAEQLGADARQVEVRQRPHRAVEAAAEAESAEVRSFKRDESPSRPCGPPIDAVRAQVVHAGSPVDAVRAQVVYAEPSVDAVRAQVVHAGSPVDAEGSQVVQAGSPVDVVNRQVVHAGPSVDAVGHQVVHAEPPVDVVNRKVVHAGRALDTVAPPLVHGRPPPRHGPRAGRPRPSMADHQTRTRQHVESIAKTGR